MPQIDRAGRFVDQNDQRGPAPRDPERGGAMYDRWSRQRRLITPPADGSRVVRGSLAGFRVGPRVDYSARAAKKCA
jgi:hypothetical protein